MFPSAVISGPGLDRLLALAGPREAGSRPEVGTDLGVVFTDGERQSQRHARGRQRVRLLAGQRS